LAFSAEPLLIEAGVRVTMTSFDRGSADFSDLAAEVAEANPDAMFFAGFNPVAILLLRQLRDAGWNGAFASGDAVCVAANCEFLAGLGDLAEGAAFSGCSPPLDPAFVAEFAKVHDGRVPTAAFIAQYSDATTILLNSVKSVFREEGGASVIDPKELRDAVSAATLPGGSPGMWHSIRQATARPARSWRTSINSPLSSGCYPAGLRMGPSFTLIRALLQGIDRRFRGMESWETEPETG